MTASYSLLLGDLVEPHIDHEPPVLLVNSGQLGYLLLIIAKDLKKLQILIWDTTASLSIFTF